jgi:hypothetical protein
MPQATEKQIKLYFALKDVVVEYIPALQEPSLDATRLTEKITNYILSFTKEALDKLKEGKDETQIS